MNKGKILKPLDIAAYNKLLPEILSLFEEVSKEIPQSEHKYLKGCLIINAVQEGKNVKVDTLRKWMRTKRFRLGWCSWVVIRKTFERLGYKTEYPLRFGGGYSMPDKHPIFNYPFSFDLEIVTHEQILWLLAHDWLVCPTNSGFVRPTTKE